MENEWTYDKLLGGDRFEVVRGVFRRQLGGFAGATATRSWITVSPWVLNDRLAEGAMDLGEISEIEARALMESIASHHPVQSLTAD